MQDPCIPASNHLNIESKRSAAEAQPINSPHPFREAGRDETLTNFLRILELGGGPLRRRPLSKNMPKSKKKHTWKETRFFMKMDLKVDLKVDPEIVKKPSRCVFWPIEKTLNSASLFFFHLLLSGTPGPSEIVQIPYKYHQIRVAALFQKTRHFLEKGVKSDPPSDP